MFKIGHLFEVDSCLIMSNKSELLLPILSLKQTLAMTVKKSTYCKIYMSGNFLKHKLKHVPRDTCDVLNCKLGFIEDMYSDHVLLYFRDVFFFQFKFNCFLVHLQCILKWQSCTTHLASLCPSHRFWCC